MFMKGPQCEIDREDLTANNQTHNFICVIT